MWPSKSNDGRRASTARTLNGDEDRKVYEGWVVIRTL